jgi:exodeoxyribonuclease V beta subunit
VSPAGDPPFSIAEDVPTARLSIAASAGTGKTYALASLAVRCVAERDITVAQLLIVTFTRAATSELRARVRERLVVAANFLSHEVTPDTDDELLTYLAGKDRATRLERVQRAIREFDSATITTIHGFASQVLGALGSTAGTDLDAVLQSDDEALRASVCSDLLTAAAAAGVAGTDLPSYADLLTATKLASGSPDMDLAPSPADMSASPRARMTSALVAQALDEMTERLRRTGTRSFGGLLADLRAALGASSDTAAVQLIRDRYTVALIDEFQDTDPVQWDIFRILFGVAGSDLSLVLVGDPKQAIYAFRGANVHTYLDAIDQSGDLTRRSLDTSWRSDGTVVDSLRVLLHGATFGDPEIGFTPTHVAPGHGGRGMTVGGCPVPALSLRLALDKDIPRSNRKPNDLMADDARLAVYRDTATRIRELLDTARIPDERDETKDRRVTPADIAVLVRTGREAAAVQAELVEQGVPAVLARGQSVLQSPAADQWRWLLWALAIPTDPGRARTFALTWFGGWDADRIAAASEEALTGLQVTMQTWSDTLAHQGVAAFIRRIWSESSVTRFVLARPDGDRAMTDLQHVGELLGQAAPAAHPSLAGLLAVLDAEPTSDLDAEGGGDTNARRIESEAKAVQVMTIWVAKGLEFPIVCCPTLWCQPLDPSIVYEDPATGRRTFDVSNREAWPDAPGAEARKRLAGQEALGEWLRLLYVAVTRARHQTIVWWSRGQRSNITALARVLFARRSGVIDPDLFYAGAVELPDDRDASAALAFLEEQSEGTIAIGTHGMSYRPRQRWVDPEVSPGAPALQVARLERALDRGRRRWSFTALTNGAGAASADPDDETLADGGAEDERADDDWEADDAEGDGRRSDGRGDDGRGADEAVPALALLPAGTEFGTLVHGVLEEVDFASTDLGGDLHREVEAALRRTPFDLTPEGTGDQDASVGVETLVSGLVTCLQTPLGASLGDRRLADLRPGDRINEMSFELHLGEAGHRPTVRDIGRVLAETLAPDDPFAGWAAGLADGPDHQVLAGHLTGSIDLIFSVCHADGPPRFVVADYKTNRLSDRGEAPRPGDYGRARMARAMVEHHYPLQALLYSVALHRYLSWRLPGYVPEVHLGGAAYLFVRGMGGAGDDGGDGHDGSQPGVFHWAIPSAAVTRLSQLLDGRAVAVSAP